MSGPSDAAETIVPHAAVVMAEGFDGICSYDGDFDRIKRVVRTEPGEETGAG